MPASLLPIAKVARLFCDWLALNAQIPLPFTLMVSKVHLTDKG